MWNPTIKEAILACCEQNGKSLEQVARDDYLWKDFCKWLNKWYHTPGANGKSPFQEDLESRQLAAPAS